jgi:hypothetical protein
VQSILPPPSPVAVSRETLESTLKNVGLDWVQTDHTKWQQVQSSLASSPPPARVARHRPVPAALPSEPLIQIETRSDAQ